MTGKGVGIGFVVASALSVSGCVLAGCSAQIPMPEGASVADAAALARAELDGTWRGTGLDGIVDRPDVEPGDPVRRDVWFTEISLCLALEDIDIYGVAYIANGYVMLPGAGQKVDIQTRLAWYRCYAQHPVDPMTSEQIATPDQLAYLYDYYARWVIPCIASTGRQVESIPTRSEYLADDSFQWTPYGSVSSYSTPVEYNDLVKKCGPEYGMLELRF